MGRPKGLAWSFFNKNDKGVTCKYCHQVYKHANVNKMERHILKCLKCPTDLKTVLKNRNRNSDMVEKNNNTPSASLTTTLDSAEDEISTITTTSASAIQLTPIKSTLRSVSNSRCSSSTPIGRPESRSQGVSSRSSFSMMDTFVDNMNLIQNEKLNEALARAILVSGCPLSMVEHPLWIEFFKQIRPSFTLPSRHRVSTTYLNNEYAAVQAQVKDELDKCTSLHLQCDGWSNMRNESIINFVITKPEPRFVDFVITEENRHDAEYLSNQMQIIMTKYGVEKFLVVIGDNAANMRAAFRILNEKFDHLVPLGCIAHLLNLLCNDILSCASVKTFMTQVTNIVKTIKNSHVLQALFVKIGKEKNVNFSLKLPVKTRWGSSLFSLQSIYANKVVLQTLAVSDEAPQQITQELKSTLLDDCIFWVRVEKMIKIFQPIVNLITKLESNEPLIHIVHSEINDIENTLIKLLPESPLQKSEEKTVLKKITARKEFALGKIHLAASLLNPLSQGCQLHPPEIIDAMECICNLGNKMGMEVGRVRTELSDYRSKEGLWAKKFLWEGLRGVNPLSWWKGLRGTNLLADIAIRILSAPVTSAATERTFSTFGWIHSKKRNRLKTERAAKITYLAHNWKLMNKGKGKNENQKLKELQAFETSATPSTSGNHPVPESNGTKKRKRIAVDEGEEENCDINIIITSSDTHTSDSNNSDSELEDEMDEDDIPYEDSESEYDLDEVDQVQEDDWMNHEEKEYTMPNMEI